MYKRRQQDRNKAEESRLDQAKPVVGEPNPKNTSLPYGRVFRDMLLVVLLLQSHSGSLQRVTSALHNSLSIPWQTGRKLLEGPPFIWEPQQAKYRLLNPTKAVRDYFIDIYWHMTFHVLAPNAATIHKWLSKNFKISIVVTW